MFWFALIAGLVYFATREDSGGDEVITGDSGLEFEVDNDLSEQPETLDGLLSRGLRIKATARVTAAHFRNPAAVRILTAALDTRPETADGFIWVTSGNDSTHSVGSLHYRDRAFDLRTRNVVGGRAAVSGWVSRLKAQLGRDYDVIDENDHVHVEYDPK